MLNTHNLSPREILQALYKNARVQGMGILQARKGDLSNNEADLLLSVGTHFDYLHGRVMKVSLENIKEIRTHLYDQDNGQGAAQAAVDAFVAEKGGSDGAVKNQSQ